MIFLAKKQGCFWVAGLITLAILRCSCTRQTVKTPVVKKPPVNIVFFNSFEAPKDTISWYWSGKQSFVNDVPPGGGRQSLKVDGDNVLPVGSFISRPLKHGGYFTIECWGKIIDVGGYVELSTIAKHEVAQTVRLNVLEPTWTHLKSQKILYCPPNHSLMMSIKTGFYADGSMLLDLIKVKKVGKAKRAYTSTSGKPAPQQPKIANR